MKIRLLPATTALAALVALTPGLASAECSWGAKHETTSNCAPGQTWDATSQSCTTPVQS